MMNDFQRSAYCIRCASDGVVTGAKARPVQKPNCSADPGIVAQAVDMRAGAQTQNPNSESPGIHEGKGRALTGQASEDLAAGEGCVHEKAKNRFGYGFAHESKMKPRGVN